MKTTAGYTFTEEDLYCVGFLLALYYLAAVGSLWLQGKI